jgi:hypothetical protein
MTDQDLKVLLFALLEIKHNGPADKEFGICWSLHKLGAPSYGNLEPIFRAWPKCDPEELEFDECCHPIKRKEGVSPWDNPLRHELLDFMIEYCEKELTK